MHRRQKSKQKSGAPRNLKHKRSRNPGSSEPPRMSLFQERLDSLHHVFVLDMKRILIESRFRTFSELDASESTDKPAKFRTGCNEVCELLADFERGILAKLLAIAQDHPEEAGRNPVDFAKRTLDKLRRGCESPGLYPESILWENSELEPAVETSRRTAHGSLYSWIIRAIELPKKGEPRRDLSFWRAPRWLGAAVDPARDASLPTNPEDRLDEIQTQKVVGRIATQMEIQLIHARKDNLRALAVDLRPLPQRIQEQVRLHAASAGTDSARARRKISKYRRPKRGEVRSKSRSRTAKGSQARAHVTHTPLLDVGTHRDLNSLVKHESLSQAQAAVALACKPRTIRLWIQQGKLSRTPKHRVPCDQKFKQVYAQVHSPATSK